jgi:hypothetical protein
MLSVLRLYGICNRMINEFVGVVLLDLERKPGAGGGESNLSSTLSAAQSDLSCHST